MKVQKKQSLQQKLAMAFAIVISSIMFISLMLHVRTVNIVRQVTYDKMDAQAEYYQQTFESELRHAINMQIEFFNDRKLPFLASPAASLGSYEERDMLLTVQERLRTITGVSSLIEKGVLYIPGNNYCITESGIRRMTENDVEEWGKYLQTSTRSIQFDGENFYSVQTGGNGSIVTENAHFILVITFSSQRVKENLALLNTSPKSGAFIYNEANDVMLESCMAESVGVRLWNCLEKDGQGEYIRVQHISVGEEKYLVSVGGMGEMGVFVQYVAENSIMEYVDQSWIAMIIFFIFMILLSVYFILYTRKVVHKPLATLTKAFEKIKEGNLDEHIYHGRNDEFSYLYQAFNDMEDRLKRLIAEVYVQKNLAQKAQMKQLQAQINPHFLYNSFFTLSRRIKRQDYENAEEFAKHLSNYFKYLTRDGSDYIPLKQEVEHAKSYAAIQQARFSEHIQVMFGELPKEYEDLLVPRLILQPLLENSFEHGLEDKVQGGLLKVIFVPQKDELKILVEDNGEEAEEQDIRKMQASLEEQELDEITGLVNIHRRLKVYFRGRAGLFIERSSLGGVSITIDIHMPPEGEEKDESEFINC